MCLCVCLVRVETKTKWCVVESKVVFDAVQSSPAVSAVAETLAFADNVGKGKFMGKVGGGGPNLVCKGIVEGLRRRRAIGFVSSTSANAIVIVGDAKRRRGDFDNCLFFLFFSVRQHNPVRRVGKHNARFFAGIL